MRRILVLGLFMVVAGASEARAQLPLQISIKGGLAIPIQNESDLYDNGFHAGIGLKFPLVPLQFEAAYDKLGASGTNEDFSALSAGLAVPVGLTPPLLPVGLYVVVGGGIYRHEAETTATDFGLNGGLGVRAGLPGLPKLFLEGRGVAVLDEVQTRSYVTAALGIRF